MKRWQKVVVAGGATVLALGLAVKLALGLPPPDLTKAATGTAAPDFALSATTGGKLALADLTKDRNLILVFYRGDW
jgi:hypothetical protein